MALFSDEDEKIKSVDKRLRRLEKNTNESMETMKNIIINISKENEMLRNHAANLEKINKELSDEIKIKGFGETVKDAVKNELKENIKLVREISSEGLVKNKKDMLAEIIRKKKKVSSTEAAKTLGTYEGIVEQWGKELEAEGIIEIKKISNNMVFISL